MIVEEYKVKVGFMNTYRDGYGHEKVERHICTSQLEVGSLIKKLTKCFTAKGFKLVDNLDDKIFYFRKNDDSFQIRVSVEKRTTNKAKTTDDFTRIIGNACDMVFGKGEDNDSRGIETIA